MSVLKNRLPESIRSYISCDSLIPALAALLGGYWLNVLSLLSTGWTRRQIQCIMAFTVVMLTGVMLFPTPNLDPVTILLVFYPVIVNTAITGSIAFDMLRGMCRDRR